VIRPRGALLGALLPLLGACGLFGGRAPIPADQDTPVHRACREESRTAPGVMALERERNTLNDYNTQRLAQESRVRENRAYRDCLLREGLALPGGVEAPRPR
jgi:hypothetical protein